MALFSDEVSIIKIGHLINAGKPVDPNMLTTEEIQAAAETMKKVAPNLRNFWASQTDTVNDFVNGNIDMTYTWPDGYWKIKNHAKMKGVPIEYMQPKEGRLAWVCGLVLGASTKVPGRATSAVAAANDPKVAAWLTDAYQYASAQQNGVAALVENKEIVTAFQLDDPPRSRRRTPGSRRRCRTAPSTSRRARTSRRPSALPDLNPSLRWRAATPATGDGSGTISHAVGGTGGIERRDGGTG